MKGMDFQRDMADMFNDNIGSLQEQVYARIYYFV